MLVALSQLETVGIWTGLFVGTASVVLALVAIFFALAVDRRTTETASATERALERIETKTNSQSDDTRGLIKFAWERMLGSIGVPSSLTTTSSDTGVEEIAAGIAAEIRAELGLVQTDEDETGGVPEIIGESDQPSVSPEEAAAERLTDIEQSLRTLHTTLESQLRMRRESPAGEVDYWLNRLTALSEESRALIAVLRGHLTSQQWSLLRRRPLLREAMRELRDVGILVPLEGYFASGKKGLVYSFAPSVEKVIRAASQLIDDPPEEVMELVQEELRLVGYRPPEL